MSNNNRPTSMIWLIWLLLCCGPAAIGYFKGRSPLMFFLWAVGLSAIAFILTGGFMSVTGAQRSTTMLTAKFFGFAGVAVSYVLAVMANASESRRLPSLWVKKTERQCPNCAGFVKVDDRKCRFCGQELK